MEADACRALVRGFYDDVWNAGRFDELEELVHDDIRFRGVLGMPVEGRSELEGYVRGLREALPDLEVVVEQLVAETHVVAARVTFRGTHTGQLLGVAGSGRQITYAGAGFFQIEDGRIREAWILGDLSGLRHQLLGSETDI